MVRHLGTRGHRQPYCRSVQRTSGYLSLATAVAVEPAPLPRPRVPVAVPTCTRCLDRGRPHVSSCSATTRRHDGSPETNTHSTVLAHLPVQLTANGSDDDDACFQLYTTRDVPKVLSRTQLLARQIGDHSFSLRRSHHLYQCVVGDDLSAF